MMRMHRRRLAIFVWALAAPLSACGPDSNPTAQAADYTQAQLRDDLTAVLTSRPAGPRSGQPLGNTRNIARWDADRIASLHAALLYAHATFYPELERLDFMRLALAQAATESTGAYDLRVAPLDLTNAVPQGLMQVTPVYIVQAYARYGLPLQTPGGQPAIAPAKLGNLDLAEPGSNVLLWAWNCKNVTVFGVSFNAWINRVAWRVETGKVTRDYGNTLYAWLAGAGHDRHKEPAGLAAYVARMGDYYIQSGFGTAAQFDALLATPLDPTPVAVR